MSDDERLREINTRLIKMEVHLEWISKFVMIILSDMKQIRDKEREEKKQ